MGKNISIEVNYFEIWFPDFIFKYLANVILLFPDENQNLVLLQFH